MFRGKPYNTLHPLQNDLGRTWHPLRNDLPKIFELFSSSPVASPQNASGSRRKIFQKSLLQIDMDHPILTRLIWIRSTTCGGHVPFCSGHWRGVERYFAPLLGHRWIKKVRAWRPEGHKRIDRPKCCRDSMTTDMCRVIDLPSWEIAAIAFRLWCSGRSASAAVHRK